MVPAHAGPLAAMFAIGTKRTIPLSRPPRQSASTYQTR